MKLVLQVLKSIFRKPYKMAFKVIRQIRQFPGRVYVWVYTALKLNRCFFRLGCSAQAQIFLLPRQLPVNRKFMHQPYWIPLDDIKWGGRPDGGEQRKGQGLGCGIVFGGNWDVEDKREIEEYLSSYIYSRTIYQIFRDGLSPEDSDQFQEMEALVSQGQCDVWQARACQSREDIIKYFDQLKTTYEEIKNEGYLTQEELGHGHWYDEIKVYIDRNGEIHKQQAAGHHRLAMARLLKLPAVPVLILGVHRNWALQVQQQFKTDVLTAIDQALIVRSPVVLES